MVDPCGMADVNGLGNFIETHLIVASNEEHAVGAVSVDGGQTD